MKGKIVLLPFPFTDLSASKYRPAMVIHEEESDVVVAFISSKIPSKASISEVLILKDNSEFKNTGLKTSSVVKLNKTATILKELVVGELGEIDPNLKKQINAKLQKIYRI